MNKNVTLLMVLLTIFSIVAVPVFLTTGNAVAASLEEAIALYRGDFLESYDAPWAIPTRERADDQNLRPRRIAHRTAASSAPSGKMDGRAAALVT